MPFIRVSTFEVDIVAGDEEYPLESYSIHGKIVYTPGNSSRSMSLLLDIGDTFVGDLAENGFPFRTSPCMPIAAENVKIIKESWCLLLSSGAKQIYPAQRNPFNADVLEKFL